MVNGILDQARAEVKLSDSPSLAGKSKRLPDLAVIKSYAAGRWLEIITALTHCSADQLSGSKKPCPKCGGNDRFRAFDDFPQTGGVVCSQCHDRNNRDGFATIQWLTGWDFPQVVRSVAEYLGLADPTRKGASIELPAIAKPAKPMEPAEGKVSKPNDPAADLQWQPWSDDLAALWCIKNRPITVDALKAFGARFAKYKNRYIVIAIPTWGPDLDQAAPVGWILYSASGGTLPSKEGPVRKKATAGSSAGINGTIERLRNKPSLVIKTEGQTDGMAALPLVDASTAIFCNAFGANENPDKPAFEFLKALLADSKLLTINDADKAGEDGLAKWSNYFAAFTESRAARLPYEVVASHGKDLRDWINEGNGRDELAALIAAAELVTHQPPTTPTRKANELPEDPHRLARANLEAYRSEHGGELKYWRGQWLKWKRDRYYFITKEEMESKVNARIKLEFDRQWELDQKAHTEKLATDPDYDKDPPSVRRVTAPIVRDTLAALRSLCTISSSIEMGTWIQGKEKRKYLACRNCIIDIAAFVEDAPPEKIFLAHSPNWFSTACLEYDFDPAASCPLWLQFISEVTGGDESKAALLQEFVGYVLSPDNNRSKFLALEGDGGHGKSAFTNGLDAIIGIENKSSVTLDAIGKRFQSFPTLGKMLNICQEANDVEGPAESFLKNFTGGNPIMFEGKGTNAFEALPTAKLLLTWNIAPRFKDRSEGLWRRMLVVKFNKKPTRPNPKLLEPGYWKRNGQLPGMLNWALLGLKRLEDQGDFTITDETKQATEAIRTANNSARLFLSENYYYREGSIQASKDVYEAYSKWCNESGMHPVNDRHFGREVAQLFRGLVLNDKRSMPMIGRVRCYINLEAGEYLPDENANPDERPDNF